MAKIAYVVLADTETPGDMGRVTNALEGARDSIESGDETQVIFDGAGTKWVAALSDESHDYHDLYASVEEHIRGTCEYCAGAYGVKMLSKRQTFLSLMSTTGTRASAILWWRAIRSSPFKRPHNLLLKGRLEHPAGPSRAILLLLDSRKASTVLSFVWSTTVLLRSYARIRTFLSLSLAGNGSYPRLQQSCSPSLL